MKAALHVGRSHTPNATGQQPAVKPKIKDGSAHLQAGSHAQVIITINTKYMYSNF